MRALAGLALLLLLVPAWAIADGGPPPTLEFDDPPGSSSFSYEVAALKFPGMTLVQYERAMDMMRGWLSRNNPTFDSFINNGPPAWDNGGGSGRVSFPGDDKGFWWGQGQAFRFFLNAVFDEVTKPYQSIR